MSGGTPGDRRSGRSIEGDRRGASEIVGLVLLFGLVIVGAAVILLSGSTAVEEVQQQNDYETKEASMEQLKSELNSVVYDAEDAEAELAVGGETNGRGPGDSLGQGMTIAADGRINFTVNGNGSCFSAVREVGSVEQKAGDDTLAYQANGIFRASGNGTTVVSPPGLTYETTNQDGIEVRTLTYPFVNVDPDNSSTGGGTVHARPKTNQSGMNLLSCRTGGTVRTVDWVETVTIRVENNEYYQAWGEFFENEFGDYPGIAVEEYDGNDTVVVPDIPLGVQDDPDRDGIPNASDNCDVTFNPGQSEICTGEGGGGSFDADGDGVPRAVDECPSTAGTGENGCPALRVTDSKNALLVNQSEVQLTFLGAETARENVTTVSVRNSTDTVLVSDETGSMVYDPDDDRGTDYYSTTQITVDDGEAWYVENQGWFVGGETVDIDDYYVQVDKYGDGNDPYGIRVDAAEGFVGTLNESIGDQAGYVTFSARYSGANAKERKALSNDLGDVASAITTDPGGSTDIAAGLDRAIETHESGGNASEDYVVLLTDGKNSDLDGDGTNADENQDTRDAAQEAKSKGMEVYVVALGDDVNEALLEDVSSGASDYYYNPDDAADLDDVYDRIAGEVNEKPTAYRIERRHVEASLQFGGNSAGFGGDVNDETGYPTRTVSFGEAGQYVSLAVDEFACNGTDEDYGDVNYSNTTYEDTGCAPGGTSQQVDNGTSAHRIYRDGDAVPSYSTDWFEQGFTDIVTAYDADLIDGGTFNLSGDQAVFVTDLGGGDYAVMLLEAEDTPGQYGSESSDVSNDYVIGIGNDEVVLDGDDDDED
jgi:hypothetical protein